MPPQDPCSPSPCGPNSQCRVVNQQAVCSCLQNYVGSPPQCRPECVVSSECPQDRACVNLKCADPCPNTCGIGAQCTTKNHNPICACPPGFTGDPFSQCTPQRKYWLHIKLLFNQLARKCELYMMLKWNVFVIIFSLPFCVIFWHSVLKILQESLWESIYLI
jgi:hypothetical protein